MKLDYQLRRSLTNKLMVFLCGFAALLAFIPLASLLIYVITQGFKDFKPSFFIHLPTAVGMPDGGMANAIVGTLELIGIASVVGLPVGIFAGVYLAEYGK